MDEYVKWSVGPFWQQILGSNKQASFIKRAGEPLFRAFTTPFSSQTGHIRRHCMCSLTHFLARAATLVEPIKQINEKLGC